MKTGETATVTKETPVPSSSHFNVLAKSGDDSLYVEGWIREKTRPVTTDTFQVRRTLERAEGKLSRPYVIQMVSMKPTPFDGITARADFSEDI